MRPSATLIPFLILAAAAAAQSPRTSGLVANPAGYAYGPSVACDQDLAAMAWFDSATGGFAIECATSDGRGVAWSAPVPVDDGTTPNVWKNLYDSSVAVAAGSVYVAWTDPRLAIPTGDRDVWFQSSLSGGSTFNPADTWVDKGLPPGLCDVKEIRMGVDQRNPTNPHDDLIAILMMVENDFTPPPWNEELYLNYSTNSGATWLPVALPFSNHGFVADVDFMDLVVDSGRIYGVWHDDFQNGIDDNCYTSCYDPAAGGFAWMDLQMDTTFPGIDVDDEVAIDARGPQVAVLFMEVLAGGGGHRLMGNTSNDGGVTWSGPGIVGTYTPFLDDCDYPDVAIAKNGNVIAAWLDDRTGIDEVCSSASPAWGLLDSQVSFGADTRPIQLICPDDMAAIVWEAPPMTPHFVDAAMSPDSGLTWYQPVGVSMNQSDIDDPAVAWDAAHGNFVIGWMADDLGQNDPYAGGFRPQTLVPVGNFFVAGSPVSFSIQDWPRRDRGMSFGVLVSNAQGAFFLADGRDLGIVKDALFQRCLSLIPGPLSGTIGPNGTGSTATFNLPVLGGTVYAVGVAFTSTSNVGYVTDVVPLP